MTQVFGAQLQTLPTIFEGHFFTVPDYQRGYAWEEKQVKEMLVDIDHLLDDQVTRRHYTGTLVFGRPSDPAGNELHVVDGQQRLTTLVILLSLLAEVLPEHDQDAFRKLYLRRGDAGSDRAVVQLNSDTRQFFERVVLFDGNPQNHDMSLESHVRLLQARKLIKNWLESRIHAGTEISALKKTVEDELGFLVYAPEEDAETGVMFEVINNRGKPLSELEKVKNFLIYCCAKLNATTLRTSIDRDWSTILKCLSKAGKTSAGDEGAFLRYCMVVHWGLNKTDSQYGYDELKKRVLLSGDYSKRVEVIQQIDQFVQFMVSAGLWYARLYGRQHDQVSPALIPIFDQIRAQAQHASIMPLFLALVIKNNGHGQNLARLLQLLEILNFRVYMARNITQRNDSGQGELYSFASSYYLDRLALSAIPDSGVVGKISITSEDDALEFRLVEFALHCALDASFEESFKLQENSNDDFFGWRGLRYFLMNYEQHLQPNKTLQIDKITLSRSEGKSNDYLSVEHLWAREFRNALGENDRPIDKFQKRRLGNFVLLELRLNIQGGNAWIGDKVAHYTSNEPSKPATDLHQVRTAIRDALAAIKRREADYRSKNYFLEVYRELIDQQEIRFTKFALKRWDLSGYLGYSALKKYFTKDAD